MPTCDSSSSLLTPEFLDALRAEDSRALREFVERYRPWLMLLARSRMGPRLAVRCDPSDIVQQTLLQALRGIPQFRGTTRAELHGWLRQVLLGALGRELRTWMRGDADAVSLDRDLAVSSQRLSAVASADPSPSQAAAQHEMELVLAELLERLPGDYRDVIIFRNLEGLPHAEVAVRMGISEGAARMLWLRALGRLRTEMRRRAPPSE